MRVWNYFNLVIIAILLSACIEHDPNIASVRRLGNQLSITLNRATAGDVRIEQLLLISTREPLPPNGFEHELWKSALTQHPEWVVITGATEIPDTHSFSQTTTLSLDSASIESNVSYILFGLSRDGVYILDARDLTTLLQRQ